MSAQAGNSIRSSRSPAHSGTRRDSSAAHLSSHPQAHNGSMNTNADRSSVTARSHLPSQPTASLVAARPPSSRSRNIPFHSAVSARPVLPPAVLPRGQPQQKPQRGASHPQARTSAVAPALDRRALQAAVQKPQSTSYTNGARSSSNPSARPPSQQPQYQRAPLPRQQQQQQQPHSVHTTIDSSYPASVLPSSAPPSHALPRERGVYPAPHSAARPSPRPSHAGSVARSPLSHDYSRNSSNGQRRVTPQQQQQQQSSGFRRPSGRDGSYPSYNSATHSHSSNPYDSGNGAMRVSSPPRVQPRSGGGGVYLEALESIPTRRTPPPPLPSQQQQQQDVYPQQQQQQQHRPRHYTAGPQRAAAPPHRPPAPPSAPQRTRSRDGSHNRSTGTDDLEAYARASPPRRASYPHYPQHNNKKDNYYYDYPEETPADSRAVALYRQPPPPPPPPPPAAPQQHLRQPPPSSSASSRPVAYYATAASHRLGPHRHVQHIIAGEVRREPPQPRRQLPPSHTPPTVEECGEEEEWVGEDAEEAYLAPAPAYHHHHHKNQRAPPPPSQQWQAPQQFPPAHQPQLRPDDTMSVMSDASSTRGSRTRHVFRHQPFMLGALPAGSPYGARPTYAVAFPRTQRPPATLYAASPPAAQQQHQQHPSRSPPQQRYEQPPYNDYDDNRYDDEDVSVDDGAMAAPTVEEPSHSVGRAGRRVVEYEPDRRRQQPHHHQQQGAVRPAMPPPQPQQQQRFAAPSMPMRQVVQYHVSVPPKQQQQQQPEEEDDRYSEQAPSDMDYHAGPPHDRTVAAAVAPQHRQQQQQPRQKLRRHPQQQGPGRPTKDRHAPLPPPLPARQHVYTEEAPEREREWDDEGDETASGHHYANRTPSGSSQRAPPPTLPPSRPLQSSDSFRPHALTRDAARQPRRPQAGPQATSRAPAVAPSSSRPVTEDELEPPSSATLAAPLRLGYERRDEGREEVEEESEGATGHQRQHRPPQPSGRPAQRHDDGDGGARPRRPSSGAPVGTTQLVVMSPPPQPPQSPSYSEEEEEEEEEESEDAAGDLEATTAPQPQQQQHQQPVAPMSVSSPSVTSRRLSVAQDADGSRAFDMDSSIDPEDLLAQQEAKKLAAELVRRSLLPPTPYVAAQAMGGGAPYSDGDGENSKDCVKGEEMPDESGEGHPGDQQTEEEPFRLDGPSAAAGGPTAAERQAEEAPQEPAAEAHKAEQDTATQRVPTPQPPEVLHATDDAPAAPDDAVAPPLPQEEEEEEEAEGSQGREPADAYDSLRNERRVSHDDATQEDVDVNASLSKEERSDHGNRDEDEEDGAKDYLTAVEQQQEGEGEELGRTRDISAAEDPHPRQHADEKVVETPDVPHSAPEQLATPPPAAHAHQHKEADTTDPHPHDAVYAAGWDSDSADASPLDVGERYGYVDPLEEAAMDAAYMLDTLEDQYVRINEETGEEMEDLVHVVELNRHDRTVEPRCFVPKGQYSDVLPLLRYPTGAAAAAAQDAEADSASTVPAAPPAHDALEYVPLSEAAYLNLCAIIWMTRFHGEDVPRLLSIAQGSSAHQEEEGEDDGAAMEGSGCYFDHPSADVVEQLDSLIIQHVRYVVEESCAQSGESFATACARLADRSNLAYLPTYVWQQSATASSLSVPSIADHVTEVLLAATVPHEARRRQAARRQLTNDAEVRAQKTWPLFLGALPWNYEEVVEAEMYATMPTAAARLAYAFMYKARMRNLSGGLGALTFSALSAQIPDAAVLDSLLMQEKLRLALLFSYRNVAACCALRQKAVKNRCVSTSLLNSQGGDREEDEGRDDSSSSNSKNNGGGGSRRRSEGETEAGQKGWTSPVFSAYLQLWEGDKAANADPAAGAGARTTTDTSTDDQPAQQQQQQAEEELTLNDDEDIVDLYSIAVQLNCFFPTKTERGMHQLCAALIEDLIATDVLMVPEEVRTPEGAVLTDRTAIVDALVVEGAQAMRHIIMTLSERGYTSAVSTEDYVSPSGQVDMAAVRDDMQSYLVLFDPAVMYFLSSPVPVDELFQYLRSDGPPSMQPHSLGRKSAFVEVLRLQHIAETIQYAMEMQDAILVSSQYNHLVAVHRRRLQQRNPHVRPTPRSIAEELQMDAVVVGHSMDLLLNAAPLLPRDHDTSLLAELANSSPAHNGGSGSGDGANRHDESLDQMRLGASNGNSMEALDNYNYNDDGEEADLSGEAVRLRAVLVALCSADPMKPVEEVQQYLRHLLVLYYEARDEHNNLVEAADPLQVAHARARAAELALVDWFGATEQNGTLTPGAAPARCDSTRVNAEELAALCPRVLGRRVGLASSAVADAAAVISASEQALAREAQADAEGLEDSVRLAETASRPPLAP